MDKNTVISKLINKTGINQTNPSNPEYPFLFSSYRLSKKTNLKKFFSTKKDTLENQNVELEIILKGLELFSPFSKEEDFYDKEVSHAFLYYVENMFNVLYNESDYDLEFSLKSYPSVYSLSFFDKRSKLKKVDDILNKIPEDKKFRRLFYESVDTLFSYVKHSGLWKRTQILIDLKINKDVVFNHLNSKIESMKVLQTLKVSDSKVETYIPMMYKNTSDPTMFKQYAAILADNYPEDRVCNLVFQSINNFSDEENTDYLEEPATALEDFVSGFKDAKRRRLSLNLILPKQPKNVNEIHDFMFERIEEESLLKDTNNFSLNQREDFLKLDNKEIEVLGETLIVKVPKTRHDLAIFSRKSMFDNCIGKSDSYAEAVRQGRSAIVGVFDKKNTPRYCIQTAKYSFQQAKGVSNESIPKEIFRALEAIITVKPELPTDFIPVEHSFIFGYSYNPQKEIMYVMFRKSEYVYEYLDIPQDVYEDFAKSDYKGSILNKVIKKYPCNRVS